MRRELERGMNPLVWLLPRYLFAAALGSQAVALVIPLAALGAISRGLLGTAVVVGLVALTVLLVDYTSAPVGSVAARLRGLAAAWTSVLVFGFTLAWYVWPDVTQLAVFGVELVSFAGGAFGAWEAQRLLPAEREEEDDEGPSLLDPSPDPLHPFRAVR